MACRAALATAAPPVEALAISSACGQGFIFLTIREHGAFVFATIMVCRNVVSTVVSALLFGHALSWTTILGFVWVFTTLIVNVLRKRGASGSRS